jgi:hypothetical protein
MGKDYHSSSHRGQVSFFHHKIILICIFPSATGRHVSGSNYCGRHCVVLCCWLGGVFFFGSGSCCHLTETPSWLGVFNPDELGRGANLLVFWLASCYLFSAVPGVRHFLFLAVTLDK